MWILFDLLDANKSSARSSMDPKIPTEAGNNLHPNFIRNVEEYIDKTKPEAVCFIDAGGDGLAVYIVNIQSIYQIPQFAEPLFH